MWHIDYNKTCDKDVVMKVFNFDSRCGRRWTKKRICLTFTFKTYCQLSTKYLTNYQFLPKLFKVLFFIYKNTVLTRNLNLFNVYYMYLNELNGNEQHILKKYD